MKKLLSIGIIAAAGLLLASSCQNDELETAGQAGDEYLVTFTLEQPGISTRAYSDGTTATTLTYAVYESGQTTALINEEITGAFDENLKATVSFNLVKGSSYDIIFWADSPTSPYTFNAEAQTITVDYTDVTSQNENLDAFYAAVTLEEIDETVNETVYLERPFAQLNIGTTDFSEASAAGFTPTMSSVTVNNVYSTLNLLDGSVSNSASVTYALAAIPDATKETFPAKNADGNSISATYLSMNYLLVNTKETVTVDFTVNNNIDSSTQSTTETPYSLTSKYENVPVQRNYRTNIYGALLTDPASFTIVINEIYTTGDLGGESDNYIPSLTDSDGNALSFDESGTASVSVEAEATSYSFDITANSETSWTVESNNENFTVESVTKASTSTSGSGNATVTVTFPENTSTSEVKADITVTVNDIITRTIAISQAAATTESGDAGSEGEGTEEGGDSGSGESGEGEGGDSESGETGEGEDTGSTTKYYVKVTEEQADWSGQYLIVYEDGPYAFDGSLSSSSNLSAANNYQTVTLTDYGIEYTETVDAISFTIAAVEGTENSYSVQSASGYYIGKTSTSSGLSANKTTVYTNTLSYDSTNGTTITSEAGTTLQVNISGENVYFRYYTAGNQKAIALYKLATE